MNYYIKNITLILFLIFLSCDKDGTVISNGFVHDSSVNSRDYSEPSQSINLSGEGCSDGNLCYELDDVFFDFTNSNGFQLDFYKFNYAHLLGSPHDPINDILTVQSFNSTWLIGIPSTSIAYNSDQILILDNQDENSFTLGTSDYVTNQVDDPSFCVCEFLVDDEETCANDSPCIQIKEDEITLSSKVFSNIKEVNWNTAQASYVVSNVSSDQFVQSYKYSHPYEEIKLVSLIDAELYEIYGDLVLVDQSEYVTRDYDIEQTLDNGDLVLTTREAEYYTQYSHLNDFDKLTSRENTDCNDNLRVDSNPEIPIFEGYISGLSFEGWCEDEGGKFEINPTLCNSFCDFGDDEAYDAGTKDIYMEEFCWQYYNGSGHVDFQFEEDKRLTGNCYTKLNEVIQWQNYNDSFYQLTFCDTGNRHYDPNEYHYEQSGDGEYGAYLAGVEPFEDRNCNGKHDTAEIIYASCADNNSDCACSNIYSCGDNNLEYYSEECASYIVLKDNQYFCDKGNRQFDNAEEKNALCTTGGEGTQGEFSDNTIYKDYMCLFEAGVTGDNKLIVDYSNINLGQTDDEAAVTSILPRAGFYDTGTDGCYDIFEDTNGGCLCEFNNSSSTVLSCEEYLSLLGITFENDEEIRNIDIALAVKSDGTEPSPYDYGTCINQIDSESKYGYSGTQKDCCIHQGCTWDADAGCSFDNENCEIDSSSEWWTERLDPNCDNLNSRDPLCEDVNIDARTQFDGVYQAGSEMTKEYIDVTLAPVDEDEDEDENYILTMEEYCELSETDKLNYSPNYYEATTFQTRLFNYDEGELGGDLMQIINQKNYRDIYDTEAVIIKSKNTLKSHPVIDQLDFDNNENLSACYNLEEGECDNHSEYSWCQWDNDEEECLVEESYSENIYNSMINNYHIVKTNFINSLGIDDYDYMIYSKTDKDVVKMIHPYYHYGDASYLPTDLDDFSTDDFWQAVHLEPDTAIYEHNGKIIEGQYFHSLNNIETDKAKYEVAKEYVVSNATAELFLYPVADPGCQDLLEEECGDEDNSWCVWGDMDQNSESECYQDPDPEKRIYNIKDCLLVSRIIETTAIGTDLSFQLRSDTYFKERYGIVKEDLFIHWDDYPWLETGFTPISSIQYMTPTSESSQQMMTSQGNFLIDYEIINNINEFENLNDFNYHPFRITNTLGVQRLEYPLNY